MMSQMLDRQQIVEVCINAEPVLSPVPRQFSRALHFPSPGGFPDPVAIEKNSDLFRNRTNSPRAFMCCMSGS